MINLVCSTLIENYDLGEDLFSSKTMTRSIQQKLCCNGVKTTKGSNQSPGLNPTENLWLDLKIAGHAQKRPN